MKSAPRRLAEVQATRPTLLFVSASWCKGRMLDSCSEGGRSTRPLAQKGVIWSTMSFMEFKRRKDFDQVVLQTLPLLDYLCRYRHAENCRRQKYQAQLHKRVFQGVTSIAIAKR